jgi:hypothetical protein
MYNGWQHGKLPSNEWVDETIEFSNHAFSLSDVVENDTTKCPCAMCRNYFRQKRKTIELHLFKFSFREAFYRMVANCCEVNVAHCSISFVFDNNCPTID